MRIENREIVIESDDERQDIVELQALFDEYNRTCFHGKLSQNLRLRWAEEIRHLRREQPAVGISSTGYYENKDGLDAPYIFVDRQFVGRDPILNLIVLHEMCHHLVAHMYGTRFDGHNVLFLQTLLKALEKLDWYPLLGECVSDFHVEKKAICQKQQ
jgi:hypothetical protein